MKINKISILTCAIIAVYITSCQVTIPDKFSQLDYAKDKDAEGYYTFAHGKYKGDLHNSIPHGNGEYVYNGGHKYKGVFANGAIDGKGLINYPDGGFFEGETILGELESGKLEYDNGDVYIGFFNDGERYGKGKLTKKNGDVYEGNFSDDQLNGSGKIIYANGDHFEGVFKDDQLDGKGFIEYVDGDRYEGRFKENKLNGQGKILRANGDRYEGEFEYNDLNGKGFIVLADGTYAQGSFTNNQLDGKGYLQKSNGDIYAGQFDLGTLDGEGSKYIEATDHFIAGNFSNGKPDGEMIIREAGAVKGEIFDRGENVTRQTYRGEAIEEIKRRNSNRLEEVNTSANRDVRENRREQDNLEKNVSRMEVEKNKELNNYQEEASPSKMEDMCRCVLMDCPPSIMLHSYNPSTERSISCRLYEDDCGTSWKYAVSINVSPDADKDEICSACSRLEESGRLQAIESRKREAREKRVCEAWKQKGSDYDEYYANELSRIESTYSNRINQLFQKLDASRAQEKRIREANKRKEAELRQAHQRNKESDIAAATQRRKQELNRQAQNRLEDLERLCNVNPDACPCWALKNKRCESLPKNPCSCSQ